MDGCSGKVEARGLCMKHYQRARVDGTIDQYARVKIVGRTCDVDWCDRPHSGRGYCAVHYNRLVYTGTPYSRREQKAMDPPICSVDGCEQAAKTRSLCRRHYQNLLRLGQPVPDKDLPVGDRFRRVGWVENLVREDLGPCWEWAGSRSDAGYGLFHASRDGYRSARAHRVMYELTYGQIDPGVVVRHDCDNPPCVNPEHLRSGSDWQNSDDMVSRHRSGHLYEKHGDRCRNGHDMTLPNAFQVRVNKRNGREYRTCLVCQYRRNKAAKERQRARQELL